MLLWGEWCVRVTAALLSTFVVLLRLHIDLDQRERPNIANIARPTSVVGQSRHSDAGESLPTPISSSIFSLHQHASKVPITDGGIDDFRRQWILNIVRRSCEANQTGDQVGPPVQPNSYYLPLFAGVVHVRVLDSLQDAFQIVARRRLQRWEFPVGQKFLLPQQLTDGQHVPVVHKRGGWAA
jgi:hypothetical protein